MGKIALSIGPFHVYWYGMVIALAVVSAIVSGIFQAKLRGEQTERIVDIALCGVPVAVICARIYYVITNWTLYAEQPGEMFFLWHGGLSFAGAVFGLLLTIILYSKWEKISFWYWADILAPGLALAQAIGVIANFVNQEAFGLPTSQPWGIYIDFNCRPAGYEQFDFFHPLFLYESLSAFLFFWLLTAVAIYQARCGRVKAGIIFLGYLIFLAMVRFILEGMYISRTDIVGQLTAEQIISLLTMGICSWLVRAKIKE